MLLYGYQISKCIYSTCIIKWKTCTDWQCLYRHFALLSSCNHVPLCLAIFIFNCPHAYYTNYSCIEIKTIKIKTLSRHMALVCKLGQNKQLQHHLRSKRLHNNIWMKLLTWVKWSKSVINFTMQLSFINVHIFVCVT